MTIAFTISLVQSLAGFIISYAIGGAEGKAVVGLIAQLILFPVGLLVMAMLLSTLLPTTFQQAFLITLCYLLVSILVIGSLTAIAFALYGLLGMKES
jgi:hypothetical protein